MATSGVQPDGLDNVYDKFHPECASITEGVAEDRLFCRQGDILEVILIIVSNRFTPPPPFFENSCT